MHWARPQPSGAQGGASGPGVDMAAAAGVPATTGAGVAAVTAGWATVGAGAAVGAGATYGAGAAADVSFSLAQAVTMANSPPRAMRDLRSIEFLFSAPQRALSKNLTNPSAATLAS